MSKRHKPSGSIKTASKHTPKEYEVKHKSKQYNKLYTQKKWRDLRARILKENPFCSCGKAANVVDHVVPWEGNLQLFYSEFIFLEGKRVRQLQAKCKSCHDRKTAKEDQKRNKKGEFISKYE